ncbi:MAG: HTTM domain-containing protein [Verrucomicrobiota bacterium]
MDDHRHRQPVQRSFPKKVVEDAFAPVDIASLVFFRIAFGLLMLWEVLRNFSHHQIALYWIEPRFLFNYYGFSWVHPWPGSGLYVHWAVLGVLALFIAAGFLYRLSAALFFLGYAYTFLLDEALYVNHTYLICLFSFLLIFVPAHRAFSIDARLNPRLPSKTIPTWSLWLFRTQMGIVYFFSGVAKVSPDWLRGEPLRTWLADITDFPIVGRFLREDWAAYSLSYAALLFDLCVVPFLLWRRTRAPAFCAALVFHLLNARFFYIGIFPWLAIAATTLFLSPGWPRRALSILRVQLSSRSVADERSPSGQNRFAVLPFVAIYMAIQLLVPLRPFFYRGGIEWICAEHRYCWRMMMLSQWVSTNFYVTDPNSGETFHVIPGDYLDRWQAQRMRWRPDMLVQFAHYLAKEMPRSGPKPLRVEARVSVSLNGRKPQLFIDQNVDLAAEERPFGRPRWLLEIHEPLPPRGERFTAYFPKNIFDEN